MAGEVVTTAGIAAANAVDSGGPKIRIASIRLATGVNYTPTIATTGFQGSTVYNGPPSGYQVIDANTVEFRLHLTPSTGNFSFGEIGLFDPDDVLFAIKVLPELQSKIASPTVGWNEITVKIRLVLTGVTAKISWTFYDTAIGRIMEVANWSNMEAPNSVNTESNAFIVHEGNDSGDSTLVVRDNVNRWVPTNYVFVGSQTAQAGSTSTDLLTTNTNFIYGASVGTGEYLLQITSGTELGHTRAVSAVVPNTSISVTLPFGETIPAGTTFRVYQSIKSYIQNIGKDQSDFVGVIFDAGMNTAPPGSMECDGRQLDRSYYSLLFSRIGTTWGAGDGTTTFHIPNLRGRFRRGWDHGYNVDPGRTFASLQASTNKGHQHDILGVFNAASAGAGVGVVADISGGEAPATAPTTIPNPADVIGRTELDGSTESRPTNYAVLPCIRVTSGLETGVAPAFIPGPGPLILPGTQAYEIPGTYSFVVPALITSLKVIVGGAGGGGGGSDGGGDSHAGGGGGSGGYWYNRTIAVTPGETLDIVVGAGGTRALWTFNGSPVYPTAGTTGTKNGAAGGLSSIKRGATNLFTATGGGGGGGNTSDDNSGYPGAAGTPNGDAGSPPWPDPNMRNNYPAVSGGVNARGYGSGGDSNGTVPLTNVQDGKDGYVWLGWGGAPLP